MNVRLYSLVGNVALACFFSSPSLNADTLDDVRDILRSRSNPQSRSADKVAEELADLGLPAVPVLLGLVDGSTLGRIIGELEQDEIFDLSAWWMGPDAFGPVALEALGRMPAKDVVPFLAGGSDGKTSLEVRLNTVRVLGELGSAQGVDLLCELATHCEDFELRYRSVRKPFEQALAGVLNGDQRSVKALARRLRTLRPGVQALIVDGVRKSDQPAAIDLLEVLMDGQYGADPDLIRAVSDLGSRYYWLLGKQPALLLQPYLEHVDANIRRAAVVALGTLQDLDSCGAMALLLEDDSPDVRRTTLVVLRKLTGATLDGEPALWNRWLAEQGAWWRQNGTALGSQLDSNNVSEVLDAVRQLSAQPFYRHRIAELLSSGMHAQEDVVQLVVCGALERMGSKTAVPFLVDLLGSSGESVDRAACQALCELTGQNLPPEPSQWKEYIRGNS